MSSGCLRTPHLCLRAKSRSNPISECSMVKCQWQFVINSIRLPVQIVICGLPQCHGSQTCDRCLLPVSLACVSFPPPVLGVMALCCVFSGLLQWLMHVLSTSSVMRQHKASWRSNSPFFWEDVGFWRRLRFSSLQVSVRRPSRKWVELPLMPASCLCVAVEIKERACC